MATPVVALVHDGMLYDVDKLEAAWGRRHPLSGRGFHTRVVGARGEGLDELDAHLKVGPQPASARLQPGEYLPLPPCDVERAAYVQLAPYRHTGFPPLYEHRDARGLVGDGQPVPFFGEAGELGLEVGMAAVLADDLWQAGLKEAEQAILGLTLILDWGRHGRPWSERPPCPQSPAQLGPALLLRHPLRVLAALTVEVEVGGRKRNAGRVGDWGKPPHETLAWLSHHVPLRAGDVIGLGCLTQGRLAPGEIAFGERVRATLRPLLRLEGWAVEVAGATHPGPGG